MKTKLIIRPVESSKNLKAFVNLPYRLYRNDPNWIPQLKSQEIEQFIPRKNPAYDTCEAQLFLAELNGRPIGRIAAIISRDLIEKEKKQIGKFGWFECEHNTDAAVKLIQIAESWLADRGMTEIAGPMGFSDNDPTGFLIKGFDELPTIAGSYCPKWYNDIVTDLGYEKDVDYVEYRITVPEKLPDRVERMVELIKRRTSVRIITAPNKRALSRKWGHKIFGALNQAYAGLHGTTLLSERQINYYIKNYLGQVDPEFIKIAVDDDRVVGFIIAMPNLSRAFQKARGRLLPFGFIHILREMKTSKVLDFYLAGIIPEYQGQGIDLLMSYEMGRSALPRGIEFAESNRELETNTKIQAQWKFYDKRLHRKSRIYRKTLSADEEKTEPNQS